MPSIVPPTWIAFRLKFWTVATHKSAVVAAASPDDDETIVVFESEPRLLLAIMLNETLDPLVLVNTFSQRANASLSGTKTLRCTLNAPIVSAGRIT